MQALREVFPDFQQCAADSTLKGLTTGGTMALHHDPLQTEKARTVMLRRRQIDEKAIDDERRRIEHKRLNAMIDLCESALCRRSALLAYFGE